MDASVAGEVREWVKKAMTKKNNLINRKRVSSVAGVAKAIDLARAGEKKVVELRSPSRMKEIMELEKQALLEFGVYTRMVRKADGEGCDDHIQWLLGKFTGEGKE